MLRHLMRITTGSSCSPLLLINSNTDNFNLHTPFHSHHTHSQMDHPIPKGTIIFSTVGRSNYGFDIFSLQLQPQPQQPTTLGPEHRLTDGVSINFNAQFLDDNQTIVFVSERTGSPRFYLTRPGLSSPKSLPFVPSSLFHDRPVVNNDRVYFISAHEDPGRLFKSWSALYSTRIVELDLARLTPLGSVDYSPAISQSGKFIAVASYGSRSWGGEFHELNTDIVVFPESDPDNRVTVCERGGWPTWFGDSVIYFHRQAEDGWWSIFRVDIPENLKLSGPPNTATRVTPPGLHCFTPAAMHDGKRLAVATRRRGKNFRHVEIFDIESETFHPVTETLNPNLHHYNPFVSPGSKFIGYHRFRGTGSTQGESTIPNLNPVLSPIKPIKMLRINASFPSFSPNGDFIAFNHNFDTNSGVKVFKSNGSKRWTLLKGRTAFYNAWSPTEKHVIYTSVGPIFQSAKATVQIARIKFDPSDLNGDGGDVKCDVKILTKEETGNNAFPSCSPDGKSIVFRSGRSGFKNLYIVDAVNGEFVDGGLRRLTEGQWLDTMPSWSPKGDLIAFSSNRHNPDDVATFGIYVVKPDGSDLRRIHVAGSEGSDDVVGERINHVCFSEDGEWLLFTANLGGVTAEPVSWPNQFQPYGDLYVVRLDGSGLRRLTCNAYENGTPAWYTGGEELDLERLCLRSEDEDEDEDELRGEFQEPLWISCDI